jgi:hypothetical protein
MREAKRGEDLILLYIFEDVPNGSVNKRNLRLHHLYCIWILLTNVDGWELKVAVILWDMSLIDQWAGKNKFTIDWMFSFEVLANSKLVFFNIYIKN